LRIFLGILAGLVVALVVQACCDFLGSTLYPTGITNMYSREQVTEAFANRPTIALLITVAGYFLAALIGGWLARRISGQGWTVWVPAGLMALMAILIVFFYPLPPWTWFASLAAPLIGGLIARHLGADPSVPAAAEAPTDASL
jgi:nitrate/nitrite transporter NarK